MFNDVAHLSDRRDVLDTPSTAIFIPPPPIEFETEAEYVAQLEGLLRGYGFKTYPETCVRHPLRKSLRVDLLAIRRGMVIAFEVKVPGSNFAWALRQARDYVLSESILGMVLACFVYPAPSDRHGSRYLEGMAKLAFYDRVGTAYDFNGLCLSFGGHVVFRQGEWTSQANRFLFGTRQFGGGRSDDWRKDRFIRRI